MELPLFEQIGDAVRSLTPEELGVVQFRAHRRGIKVWFDSETPPREHYEAQLIPRRHIDGTDGMVLEIGYHAEHREPAANTEAIAVIGATESTWREILGDEAEMGPFLGNDDWRRVSEVWFDFDLEDPEMAVEVASRVVDYLEAIEPART